MSTTTIALLGSGSFGTAVAIHLAQSGHRVLLWGRNAEDIIDMQHTRENKRYLPGIPLPALIEPTTDLNVCIQQAQHYIIGTPSHAFKTILHQLPKTLSNLCWLTKGIDPESNQLFSELVLNYFDQPPLMGMIAGPSFAKEIATGIPTALVIAGPSKPYLETIRNLFEQNTVRTYLTEDLVGVQLCGAIKNVIAIACGMSDGLAFGANTKATIITRGLAEMTRLGLALGAQEKTFIGLAGLGDLVLTCTDNQSRNRRFGLLLGQNYSIQEALNEIKQVIEGKENAAQVCTLARQYHISLPISESVHEVLSGRYSPLDAAKRLMLRPLKNVE